MGTLRDLFLLGLKEGEKMQIPFGITQGQERYSKYNRMELK